MPPASDVWTVSQMEKALGLPRHRVLYVIESRGIKPAGKIGNTNIYNHDDYDRVRSELTRIATERSATGGVK